MSVVIKHGTTLFGVLELFEEVTNLAKSRKCRGHIFTSIFGKIGISLGKKKD